MTIESEMYVYFSLIMINFGRLKLKYLSMKVKKSINLNKDIVIFY